MDRTVSLQLDYRFWPEPFVRIAEICTNPMAANWL